MGKHHQQFDSHSEWVRYASSWLTCHERYGEFFRAVCVDAKGRICRNGGDFKRADEEGAFPVRWWWPDQPIDELAVATETGLTPRQLADQRAELLGQALEALEAARIELENEGAWVPTKVTDVLELAGKEK